MDDDQTGDTSQSRDVEAQLGGRRKSERTTALFRPALLEIEGWHSFCLVRNISSSGLMVSLQAPVKLDQAVSVRFDEATELNGRIAWHEADRAGIEFSQTINVEELLVSLSNDSSRRGSYRSPRMEIEADATFIVHGTSHAIRVKDISQRGMKAVAPSPREGEEGTVILPGLQPRKAVTRWAKDGLAGFYFLDPIGFFELGQWVLAHNERKQSQRTA